MIYVILTCLIVRAINGDISTAKIKNHAERDRNPNVRDVFVVLYNQNHQMLNSVRVDHCRVAMIVRDPTGCTLLDV